MAINHAIHLCNNTQYIHKQQAHTLGGHHEAIKFVLVLSGPDLLLVALSVCPSLSLSLSRKEKGDILDTSWLVGRSTWLEWDHIDSIGSGVGEFLANFKFKFSNLKCPLHFAGRRRQIQSIGGHH